MTATSPIRILFVNRMASMVRGGGETFDLEVAVQLEALGCETSFLSGLPLCGRATSPLDRPRVYHVRSPYSGNLPWDQFPGGWRLRLADFWLFERLAARWALAHRQAFDLVQVCELPSFVHLIKKQDTSLPVVMRLTAPDYHDPRGGVALADAVVASGDTMRKMRAGARPDCFDVPNGVDASRFRPQASSFRADHDIGEDELVVLLAARFQSVKNHQMLLEAFAEVVRELGKGRLVFAGSGPLEKIVRQGCSALGLGPHVLFLGEVPNRELPMVYAAADIKVIASNYESFCFAALEAMAAGLPLVVTDTDWVPDLIGRGPGGHVVPIGDAAAMAAALLDLAQDPEKRKAMGSWNRARAKADFAWPASARKLKRVYEGLLEPRRRGDTERS